MGTILVCDIGSTNMRAAIVDAHGSIMQQATCPAPEISTGRATAEIDPDAWWRCFLELTEILAAQVASHFCDIAAICVCGVTRAQVYLDADGAIVRPAMTWSDTRADAIAAEIKTRHACYTEVQHLNGFHPLARLAWISDQENEKFCRIATVLEPKDFLNFRLTGLYASDSISMARLQAAAMHCNDCSLFEDIGADISLLPHLCNPCSIVGSVRADHDGALRQLSGRPVICGCHDTYAAVLGLGAMQPGTAYNISGTTEVLGILSDRTAVAPGLIGLDWGGLFHLGGPSQNGADVIAWLNGIVGETAEVSETLAADMQQSLLFLPYLSGERVPFWDPQRRGAFIGLNRQHGRAAMARAVMEGIAFQNRIVLERAEKALAIEAAEIRFGGGGAGSMVWRQIKADILGRPVIIGAVQEPGLLGAAMLGFTGLGEFSSLARAQTAMARVAAIYRPNAQRADYYQNLYRQFLAADQALAPISAALASMQAP